MGWKGNKLSGSTPDRLTRLKRPSRKGSPQESESEEECASQGSPDWVKVSQHYQHTQVFRSNFPQLKILLYQSEDDIWVNVFSQHSFVGILLQEALSKLHLQVFLNWKNHFPKKKYNITEIICMLLREGLRGSWLNFFVYDQSQRWDLSLPSLPPAV